MARNPAFPFYANDYLVDTLRWSRGMKSLHVDLLCESWANKQLKDDDGAPEGLSGEDRKIWTKIVHKWKLVDGNWINEKLEKCRIERQNFLNKQSEKGKKSAEVRKQTQPKVNTGSTTVEPLEEEEEKEDFVFKSKKELRDFSKPDVDGEDLVFPIDTEPVRKLWEGWKKSRWEHHNARYGIMGEQADLKRLQGMNFSQIEETLLAAISGKWKNLYPDKNGFSKTTRKESDYGRRKGFAERYGSDAGG